jgi:hypothetical protein
MRACFLVKLGVEFIKLPEFRRAQFRTSFLIANYDTEYYHQKRRQYILITFLWLADVLYRPTFLTYYESWPPRIASYLRPKHFLFFVYYLVLLWSAAHQMPHKSIWIISYSSIILMNSNNNSTIDSKNNNTDRLRDQIRKMGIKYED